MTTVGKMLTRTTLGALALGAASAAQAAILYSFDGTLVRPDPAGLKIHNMKWTYITPDFISLAPGGFLPVPLSALASCTATKFVGSVASGPVGCGTINFSRGSTDNFVNFSISDATEPTGSISGFLYVGANDSLATIGTRSDSFPAGGGTNSGTLTISIAPVPETASWAMMIAGFGIAGVAMRRRALKVRYA
jgi:hypothetical protein